MGWVPFQLLYLGPFSIVRCTEVAQKLRVTRRTLHEYRDSGLIPYYAIGGKYIYSEKDLCDVLTKNYRHADIP